MQAIILCGGLSTRLGDITKEIPKILLSIGCQTVLDHQLNLLKSVNVTEVILASGHLHEVLFKSIGHQHQGLKVLYAKEDKRLGTGGAIKNAMKYISSEPFLVLNGDILVEGLNLAQMLSCQNKIERDLDATIDGLLLSTLVGDVRDFGEVISDQSGKILAFKEKQSDLHAGYINGGIYLFNKSIYNYFPDPDVFSLERDVFPIVNQLYSWQTRANLIDVGVSERLEYARQKYSSHS